jgi:hypothetical protein
MSANGPASSSVKPPVHANPISWLILGGVLLIAAITVGTTIMAGNFRERALNSSKRELENTVLLLARHFEQQFEDFGAIQEDIVKYMQSAGVDAGDYRRRMSNLDIHEMLKAKIGALSYVGGINLSIQTERWSIRRSSGRFRPSMSPIGPISNPSNRAPGRRRSWSNRCTVA